MQRLRQIYVSGASHSASQGAPSRHVNSMVCCHIEEALVRYASNALPVTRSHNSIEAFFFLPNPCPQTSRNRTRLDSKSPRPFAGGSLRRGDASAGSGRTESNQFAPTYQPWSPRALLDTAIVVEKLASVRAQGAARVSKF